jgi:hypothetical protein
MSGIQVRGYTVQKAAGYLRSRVGEAEANRMFQAFSPELQHALETAAPAAWLPVAHIAELHRAVASLGGGDDTRAQHELVTCGRTMSGEATNTFLKLVMRVLTPTLFAKKLPSLWARDATGGKYNVDVSEDRLVCRLTEMEAFDHIGPVSVGYVTFALEAMGKTVEKTALHNWSLANPSAPDCWFELTWKV